MQYEKKFSFMVIHSQCMHIFGFNMFAVYIIVMKYSLE